MSSITATLTHPQMMSPRERLQEALESGVSSGTIEASDQTALEAALDTIDETMRASRPTEGAGRSAGSDTVRQKISDLIDEQGDAGSLTADQADELKNLLTTTSQGGPGGAGGPPPPPREGEASSDTSSSSSTSSDLMTLLADFLKRLQETKSTTTAYGTDGTTSSTGGTALVLDTAA